jgi:hypothetical protein
MDRSNWKIPQYCLFQPVADFISKTDRRTKLEDQFTKQSQLVPLVPLSIEEAINGPISHWLPGQIEDILYVEMCELEIDDPEGYSWEKTSKYRIEAAKYAGKISAGNFVGANSKYKPVFEIHYTDFTPRLQEELQRLLKDSPSTLASIVEYAVFRIFKARHKLIFYDYIENEGLNWRFVAN